MFRREARDGTVWASLSHHLSLNKTTSRSYPIHRNLGFFSPFFIRDKIMIAFYPNNSVSKRNPIILISTLQGALVKGKRRNS
jgi:hypothetical protein